MEYGAHLGFFQIRSYESNGGVPRGIGINRSIVSFMRVVFFMFCLGGVRRVGCGGRSYLMRLVIRWAGSKRWLAGQGLRQA